MCELYINTIAEQVISAVLNINAFVRSSASCSRLFVIGSGERRTRLARSRRFTNPPYSISLATKQELVANGTPLTVHRLLLLSCRRLREFCEFFHVFWEFVSVVLEHGGQFGDGGGGVVSSLSWDSASPSSKFVATRAPTSSASSMASPMTTLTSATRVSVLPTLNTHRRLSRASRATVTSLCGRCVVVCRGSFEQVLSIRSRAFRPRRGVAFTRPPASCVDRPTSFSNDNPARAPAVRFR